MLRYGDLEKKEQLESARQPHQFGRPYCLRCSSETGGTFPCVTFRLQTLCLFFLYLSVMVKGASAQTGSTEPSVETIVARMAQARAENRAGFRPYIVTRDYMLLGKEKDKPKFQVIADVAFVPPDSKKYTIEQTNGSGLGGMIVRRMLATEAEVAKNYAATDFSPENYGFRFIREEDTSGQRCYVMELLPRRKDKYLLRGNVWVDANTYLPRRFEGELAKNPSRWVQDVRVVFIFGEVGGMWLQTAAQASGNVWILGRSTMVSHDVCYKLNEVVIAASAPLDGSSRLPLVVGPPH
jgi:hypothetical protein